MPDPEGLLERLVRHEVEFVVIGGFAAIAHGATLLTQDVDICCRFSAENLARLARALEGLKPVHRLTPRRTPLALDRKSCRGLKNLYLDTDLGVVDCLGAVTGIGDFDEVARHSVIVKLPAGRCPILDLDALIRSKAAMDRPRDREAIVQLRAIRSRQ